MATHYDALGLTVSATADEIKAAYRALARKYHPDLNKDEKAVERFIQVKEAYEVLSNPGRRKNYDEVLRLRENRTVTTPAPPSPRVKPAEQPPKPEPFNVDAKTVQLTRHLSRMEYQAAGTLAKEILRHDPKNAIAYAALGDLARNSGDLAEAAKQYSYAAQFDPRNPTYERKYMELMEVADQPKRVTGDAVRPAPLGVGAFVVAMLALLLFLLPGSLGPGLSLISTWGLTHLVVYPLSGLALGLALPLAGVVDGHRHTQMGGLAKVAPSLAFAAAALLNYWIGVLGVAWIVIRNGSLNLALTRMVTGVGVLTFVFSLLALFVSTTAFFQTLVWAGGLIYIGALAGWVVSDSIPRGA